MSASGSTVNFASALFSSSGGRAVSSIPPPRMALSARPGPLGPAKDAVAAGAVRPRDLGSRVLEREPG